MILEFFGNIGQQPILLFGAPLKSASICVRSTIPTICRGIVGIVDLAPKGTGTDTHKGYDTRGSMVDSTTPQSKGTRAREQHDHE